MHQGNRKPPTFACDAFCSGLASCKGGSSVSNHTYQSSGKSCQKIVRICWQAEKDFFDSITDPLVHHGFWLLPVKKRSLSMAMKKHRRETFTVLKQWSQSVLWPTDRPIVRAEAGNFLSGQTFFLLRGQPLVSSALCSWTAVAPWNPCAISPFGSFSASYWIPGTESLLWALLACGLSPEWFGPFAAGVFLVTTLPPSTGWWEWSCLCLQNPSTEWWSYYPHSMALTPVLVSSLESPSGLKTIYGSASKVPAPVQDLNSHSVCGASCCVGDGDEIWSGGLSHLRTRSWRSQNLFSAPWSFAEHGGRTECRASTTVSHPPFFDPPPCGQRHTAACTAHMSVEVHTSSPSWYNAGT